MAEPIFEKPHWLNIANLLADVAFETDAEGQFTAFGNGYPLGYPAADLLGLNLSSIFVLKSDTALEASSFAAIFATIRSQNIAWRGVVDLERANGSQGTYQIILAPKAAAPNATADGSYGLLIDQNAPELDINAEIDTTKAMLDPQTGLWSATTFAEAAGRRFDRLDVEGQPGTLLLLGFGQTPAIGRAAVAIRLAEELRDIIRPTDLLGRINTTTFALWCDGMDHLTGAERAARFCQRLPPALPGNSRISVGLAARWPGSLDDPQTLIGQASAALRLAEAVSKAAAEAGNTESISQGTWRVWSADLSL